MLRAIFIKEYCKIRRFWLLLLLLNLAVSLQMVAGVRSFFLSEHAEIAWYRVIQLGNLYCEQLRFLPLVSGILLGVFQFLPETRDNRLRLGLHLPITPQRLILCHLAAGWVMLSGVLMPDILLLAGVTWYWFPPRWPLTLFFTVLPWFLAGVSGYLGSVLVLVEPDLRLKGCNAVVAAGVSGCYLVQQTPGAFQEDALLLVLPLMLMVPAVLYPTLRFRCRRSG